MARVLACLPLNEVSAGTTYLSDTFGPVQIQRNPAGWDELKTDTTQILLFVEEDFSHTDNIYRLMSCRHFQYLFFSKAADPRWQGNCGLGRLVDESECFILWQVQT